MSIEINKHTTIGEIIRKDLNKIFVLHKYGMDCLYCPAKNNETIETCARSHNVDLEILLNDLRKG